MGYSDFIGALHAITRTPPGADLSHVEREVGELDDLHRVAAVSLIAMKVGMAQAQPTASESAVLNAVLGKEVLTGENPTETWNPWQDYRQMVQGIEAAREKKKPPEFEAFTASLREDLFSRPGTVRPVIDAWLQFQTGFPPKK